MHIALLNDDSLPSAHGGAAVVAESLRQRLAMHGHKISFITTHRPKDSHDSIPIRHSDFYGEIISIPVEYPSAKRHFMCIKNPDVSPVLDTLFTKLQPDIVHAHNIHTYLTYDALLIAKKYTDRIFLTAHDTFLVSYERVKSPRKMHIWEHIRVAGRKYNPLRNTLIKSILRRSGTKVISISNVLKNFLEQNHIPVHQVIHNGTQIPVSSSIDEIHAWKQKWNITGPTILYGGRASDDKGINVFLDAVQKIYVQNPDIQFVIVGDKDRLHAYLKLVPEHIQKNVITPGWLSKEEMNLVYDACDVVTTPSIYLDPFNLMNIEAMAHGKPVVGTTFGGTPEVIKENQTGYVRNPKETFSYAGALLSLIEDPDTARKMGQAGKKRVKEHFSVEKMAEQYMREYGIMF